MIQPFYIFQLTEEEAQKIAASPAEPHQHDFEELIKGIEGKLEHFIDFKTTEVGALFISFVTQGKIHRLIPRLKDGHCKWWVLRFKSEFIPDTTFQRESILHKCI